MLLPDEQVGHGVEEPSVDDRPPARPPDDAGPPPRVVLEGRHRLVDPVLAVAGVDGGVLHVELEGVVAGAEALEGGDEIRLVDVAPAAAPGLAQPVLRALIDDHGLTVRAKLGWTDVARFAAAGIPACNLGPGDARLAHTAGECVDRASLERTYDVLRSVLTTPPDAGPSKPTT